MKKGIQLVTDIMGTRIKTPKGEDVGVIQNMMINPQDGTIVYIVLCFANFFGKTNRHFAIPRKCLEIRGTENSLYFEIDEKELLIAAEYSTPKYSYLNQESVCELFEGTPEFMPKYLN